MTRFALPLALLAACAPAETDFTGEPLATDRIAATCDALGGTWSGVTFTDEEAVNAVDFADNATIEELDALYGVGTSVGNKIINGRPYATQPDPMAALDAVAYVGPEVLTSFRDDSMGLWCSLDDGRQSCCADIACEGIGGTVEQYVEVDDAKAHVLLDWGNRATSDQLQEVCEVGPVVAADLVAARPMRTIYDLADVPRIGSHAIQAFLGNPLFACTTKGSVLDTWCGQPEADCTCDGTALPEPPAEPVYEELWTEDATTLPDAIQQVIAAYGTDDGLCDGDRHAWYPKFLDATIHLTDGVVTGYDVRMLQLIDPEGGIQYMIWIDFDGDGRELDLSCGV